MFGGKALGWMAETLIRMPGAPRANVPSECVCFGSTSCCQTLDGGLTDGGSWQYLT